MELKKEKVIWEGMKQNWEDIKLFFSFLFAVGNPKGILKIDVPRKLMESKN